MKKIIIALVSCVALASLINCGKKSGSSAAPATPLADNSTQIQYSDGTNPNITWTQSSNNIYMPANNGCLRGLKTSADDTIVKKVYGEITALINSSTVSRGSLQAAAAGSTYLTINYADGSSRMFNLDNDKAATDQEILSKGPQIKQLYLEIAGEINRLGIITCPAGK